MENTDYDFEYLDGTFHVQHDGKVAYIMDEDWDSVVSVYNANHWPHGAPMPKSFAIVALASYRDGQEDGDKHGYWRCQYDVKKVLGIKNND